MWSYLDLEDIACIVEDIDAGRIAEGDIITIYVKLVSLLLFERANNALECFELVRGTVRDESEK